MRVSRRPAAATDRQQQPRDQWEYFTAAGATPEFLNQLGIEGWELVCGYTNDYGNYRLYFKRKLK